jgi:glycosyltransferase involved in cell wall biosynthesis
VDIINEFVHKDPRIRIKKLEKNSGPAIARNTSIKSADGDVIAFLDADDLWDNDFLEKSLYVMEKQRAGIVFSSYRRRSEDLSKDLGEFIVPDTTNYHELLKSCAISCLTGMYHVKRCQGKVFMPDIKKRQDYCLWLALLKRIDKAHGIKDVLATYRIRNDSVSRNKLKAAYYQWKVYREIEHLPFITSCYYFVHYFTKGLIKNYALLTAR